MAISKDMTLYARDDKGELLPVEVNVTVDPEDRAQDAYVGETITLTPMTRGEIKKMFADLSQVSAEDAAKKERDVDGELILKHCVVPAYEKDDLKFATPAFTTVFVNTLFKQSGLEPKLGKKEAIEKKEDEFAKN